MNGDAVLALESLGYTRREALFLYLVVVHSGYFVRRQFDYFIDRVAGAIAQKLIEKSRAFGHVEVIDYANGYRVYHLHSKTIYRLLGDAESQNRRRKSDAAIRARLISLDYVLEHENHRFMESADERVQFFGQVRRIPSGLFADETGKLLPLLGTFPIALTDRAHPSNSEVSFVFADEALVTVEKFRRFLEITEPLFCALGKVEVVYASNTEQNFAAALREFKKRFARNQQSSFDGWRESSPVSTSYAPPFQAKFTTILFSFSYPKIMRKDAASLVASRP